MFKVVVVLSSQSDNIENIVVKRVKNSTDRKFTRRRSTASLKIAWTASARFYNYGGSLGLKRVFEIGYLPANT